MILNYQSYKDTIEYVENLQKQRNIKLNILIVDNCSPNNSYAILKNTFAHANNIEVIKTERNGGYAYGNNYGLWYLKDKRSDYILISNNDIHIDDNMLLFKLMNTYKLLENPAFASPIMTVNGNPSKNSAWKMTTLKDDIVGSLRMLEGVFKSRRNYNFTTNNDYLEVDCLSGSFFLGKKNIFYDIGLFDENTFLYMEEEIIAKKVKEISLRNYLVTSMHYEHITAQTITYELDLFKMRHHLINSRIYFHENYLLTNKAGIFILKLLYEVWKIETFLYLKLKHLFSRLA